MRKECYITTYNESKNELRFIKKNQGKVAKTICGKYGIEMALNINEEPIYISIPVPDIVLGFKVNKIKQFCREKND